MGGKSKIIGIRSKEAKARAGFTTSDLAIGDQSRALEPGLSFPLFEGAPSIYPHTSVAQRIEDLRRLLLDDFASVY